MRVFLAGAMAAFLFAAAAAEDDFRSTLRQHPGGLKEGTYYIWQIATGQYLDAYDNDRNYAYRDYRCEMTSKGLHPYMNQEGDASKEWVVTPTSGGAYTIQQKINMRYLDAFESRKQDYSAVTRLAQGDASQEWILTPSDRGIDAYTIQQKKNMRYLTQQQDCCFRGKRVWVHDVVTREFGEYYQEITPDQHRKPTKIGGSQDWVLTAVSEATSAAMAMPGTSWKHASDHAVQPGMLALAAITIGLSLLTLIVAKWRSAHDNVAQPLLLG